MAKKLDKSNADSFAQLLDEIKAKFKFVKDFYYDDHNGVWCVQYKVEDDINDKEFTTIFKALKYHKSQQP